MLAPAPKLARPEPMTSDVAFVEAVQLGERHRDELLGVFRRGQGRRERTDRGVVDRQLVAHDRVHDLGERLAVAEPHRIGLWQRLSHLRVTLARTLIRPHEHVAQRLDLLQLVHGERAFEVVPLGHVEERQRRQVCLMKGMLAASRDTRLLTSSNGCKYGKWTIAKNACSNGSVIAAAFASSRSNSSSSRCGDRQRQVHGAADRHLDLANAADCFGIGEQVLGEQRVQVADRVAVEVDLLDALHQHLDRRLVVEDHLRSR